MVKVRRPLLLLLLAPALGGCAGAVSAGSFTGEAHQVVERVAAFQRDGTEAQPRKLCDQDLSSTLRHDIARAGRSCEEVVKEELKAAEEISLAVKAVKVSGNRAAATVESVWWGENCTETVLEEKEGNVWRISGIEGSCPRKVTGTGASGHSGVRSKSGTPRS